ncbi:MAG: cupredoxin domain-containing protein [bacterium]|nr:cupredoxin domain-containing protein [bacterium]
MKQALVILGVLVVAALAFFLLQGNGTNEAPGEGDAAALEDGATFNDDGIQPESGQAPTGAGGDAALNADVSVELAADANVETVTLTGKPFEFSQKEIRVKKGDMVTVHFQSTAGLHDFVVDEFNAATDQVQPGSATSVTFVADKAGEFEFYCSVGNHRAQGMVGTFIVEE